MNDNSTNLIAAQPLTDDELFALAFELDEVRAEARGLRKREDELKERFRQAFPDGTTDPRMRTTKDDASGQTVEISVRGVDLIKVSTSKRTTVNRKKLEAMHPEVFTDVKETGTTAKIEVVPEGLARLEMQIGAGDVDE
jgi:hypothetical protein